MLYLNLDSRDLSIADRGQIDRLLAKTVREVSARRDIVREGDRPRAINVILEGWACRYKQMPDGRRQIVSFLLPGDICDASALLLDEMDHSLGAVTRVLHAEILPADLVSLMASSPRIARALWRQELVTSSIQREWLTNVGQRTAFERLAHLLCELFLRLSSAGLSDGDSCDFPLTQTDLAEATGLTAVHVNRTLQDLRRRGLIQLSARRLTVPDGRALAAAAPFNAAYLHAAPVGDTARASSWMSL